MLPQLVQTEDGGAQAEWELSSSDAMECVDSAASPELPEVTSPHAQSTSGSEQPHWHLSPEAPEITESEHCSAQPPSQKTAASDSEAGSPWQPWVEIEEDNVKRHLEDTA